MNSSPKLAGTLPSGPLHYQSVTSLQVLSPLVTKGLFSLPASTANVSPIDQFISNTNAINLVYIKLPDPLPEGLGTLVLLGYMSAVESFFRTMLRGLINTDAHTRTLSEPLEVKFGAALHHKAELLPEALFEDISFAERRRIVDTLKDIIGIKGNFPNEVNTVIDEYRKVCELRHCCVHRFGKLGANNAIRLGMDEHKVILEHPFTPTTNNLQEIADLLRTFVKTINNFVFRSVLDRTAAVHQYAGKKASVEWKWNFNQDRATFRKYYTLFASNADSPPSAPIKDVYDSFKVSCLDFRAKPKKKKGGP